MTGLVAQVHAVVQSLTAGRIPFALGGALALAYATAEPRGTRDIDVNVFVPSTRARQVLAALPPGVRWDQEDLDVIERDGQVRLWWDQTPVDLFFADHAVHDRAGERIRLVDFVGVTMPILAPIDLALFKVLFDRAKDWADLESMVESEQLDTEALASQVADLLGEDSRVERVRRLGQS